MNSILDILRHYDVDFRESGHRHVTAGWVGTDCFRCSPGRKSFKLGISLAYGGCNCWTCGSIPLTEVLRELTGEPWYRCKELASRIRFEPLGPVDRPRGRLVVPNAVNAMLGAHRAYLRRRNLDPNVCERVWGIKGIALAARLAWRLWFPVHYRGEIVSWTTRSLVDEGVRYISASPEEEKMPHKHLLMGMDLVRHAAVVVEGPLDMVRVGPGACATFGTTFSRQQVAMLSKVPVRAVVYDNEPEAQRRARQLCDALGCFPGSTHLVQIDAADPGSASDKEIKLLRKCFLD